MYQAHWGLREPPFRDTPTTMPYFPSAVQQEALARLHFLVSEGRRVGLVVGPRGSGKSMLFAEFARQLHGFNTTVGLLNLIGVTADEIPWLVTDALGLATATHISTTAIWRRIRDRLEENRFQQKATVLLLDDFDRSDDGVDRLVARLVHTDQMGNGFLTVLMATGPDSAESLSPSLSELADLRIKLTPWDEGETSQYISQSMARAGRLSPAFEDSAVSRLHKLAGGLPRRINQLAELSLLAGASQLTDVIGTATVDAVQESVIGDR